MRILVYGAGVIGSLYAAKLQAAGQEVTVLARGSVCATSAGTVSWWSRRARAPV